MDQTFKLCILRLSAIGDVCHAVAMVRRIQSEIPNVRITWVIGSIEHQLLYDLEGVEFIVYDKKSGKQGVNELKHALANIEFDALFIMQVALRANLISLAIKAKRRIGFDWHRSKEFHWFFANERIRAQSHAHVLDGFMGFADKITNKNSNSLSRKYHLSWDIPIPESDMAWAKSSVGELGKFVVLCPAASKAERNWTPHGYALISDYCKSIGLGVVICGGPGSLDLEISSNILTHTNSIDLNLVGKTNLKQLLAVLSLAKLVIAPDTGPAHMATAVKTPVLGLYAHSNPRRTGPYLNRNEVVSVYDEHILNQQGKPWNELSWGIRAKGEDLMSSITITSVIAAVDKLLS